jgi:hypothetical protein
MINAPTSALHIKMPECKICTKVLNCTVWLFFLQFSSPFYSKQSKTSTTMRSSGLGGSTPTSLSTEGGILQASSQLQFEARSLELQLPFPLPGRHLKPKDVPCHTRPQNSALTINLPRFLYNLGGGYSL